jgi:4'-phosphopantetheinyl transferase EntD
MTPDREVAFLSEMIASMYGPDIVVRAARPRDVRSELFPEEIQYIAKAVSKRQAEFGTARVCARNALSQLGVTPCSLVPNSDRSPRWPPGIRGSISHTDNCCAVVVTRASWIRGLGLDLEVNTPLQPNVEAMVCTAAEARWLDKFDYHNRGWLGKLLFSAKEAFYKCQYTSTLTFLEFQDVELLIDLEAKAFSVTRVSYNGELRTRMLRIRGKFDEGAGLIATSAVLTT